MCRWLAFTGEPVFLDEVLFKLEHNLIDQSLSARSAETPTNGDGFGVGWYGERPEPGLFRSIRPAWNDANLRSLAANIRSGLFLAHVRATSLATVQETNCHPFRYRNWLFVHNGEVFEIETMRRALLLAVDPALFGNILGTTDSELLFHLALTLGLRSDPPGALARMAGLVERTGRSVGVDEALWMTLGVSDGRTLWAVRYASDGEAPSLYYTPSMEEFYALNPHARGTFGPGTRAVTSEPQGRQAQLWRDVPQGALLTVRDGEVHMQPFRPVDPGVAVA